MVNKNNGAVVGAISKIAAKTPAYKINARLEKKTEIKTVENTSPFSSKESAVIASLFPNYTLLLFSFETSLLFDPDLSCQV